MRQGGCCSQKLTSNSAQRRFFYSLFHTLRYSLALNFPTKRENRRRRRRLRRCCTVVANVSSQTLSLGLRRQCHGATKTCNFTLNRLQRRTRAKPSAVALCNVRAYVAYVAAAKLVDRTRRRRRQSRWLSLDSPNLGEQHDSRTRSRSTSVVEPKQKRMKLFESKNSQ